MACGKSAMVAALESSVKKIFARCNKLLPMHGSSRKPIKVSWNLLCWAAPCWELWLLSPKIRRLLQQLVNWEVSCPWKMIIFFLSCMWGELGEPFFHHSSQKPIKNISVIATYLRPLLTAVSHSKGAAVPAFPWGKSTWLSTSSACRMYCNW